VPEPLEALRLWEGSPIPNGRHRRVLQVYAHHQFLSQQIAELEAERRVWLQSSKEASLEQGRQLMQLRGSGINGSWGLVREFFGWRDFKNRRETGAERV
jgi:transposase